MAGFLALVFALSHTHSHAVQMNAHTNVTDCDSQCLKRKKKKKVLSHLFSPHHKSDILQSLFDDISESGGQIGGVECLTNLYE